MLAQMPASGEKSDENRVWDPMLDVGIERYWDPVQTWLSQAKRIALLRLLGKCKKTDKATGLTLDAATDSLRPTP